jgi:hypothetical protein
MDKEQFENNPRDYALQMVEDGLISAHAMLLVIIGRVSNDDVRDSLDANELSPRFGDDDEEE